MSKIDCIYTCLHLTTLDNVRQYATIVAYLSHHEGGYDDRYGTIPDSRGGSKRSSGFRRDGTPIHQAQGACGIQDRWRISSISRRSENVYGGQEDHQREKLTDTRGLLTSLPTAVKPEHPLTGSQSMGGSPLSHCRVRRSIESRHVYYSGWRQNRQGRDRECLVFMPTTLMRSRTSEREVPM